jgi:hypothetical protein
MTCHRWLAGEHCGQAPALPGEPFVADCVDPAMYASQPAYAVRLRCRASRITDYSKLPGRYNAMLSGCQFKEWSMPQRWLLFVAHRATSDDRLRLSPALSDQPLSRGGCRVLGAAGCL